MDWNKVTEYTDEVLEWRDHFKEYESKCAAEIFIKEYADLMFRNLVMHIAFVNMFHGKSLKEVHEIYKDYDDLKLKMKEQEDAIQDLREKLPRK